jgi:hypothetical protein
MVNASGEAAFQIFESGINNIEDQMRNEQNAWKVCSEYKEAMERELIADGHN